MSQTRRSTKSKPIYSPSYTSHVVLNTSYLKTVPGLLKLFELIIGVVVVGLMAHFYQRAQILYYGTLRVYTGNPDLFLFLMAVTFMILTFCLLLACITSNADISKTVYEIIYHSIAAILLFAASLYLIIEMRHWGRGTQYDAYIAAAVLGLINAILYFVSAVLPCCKR